MSQMVTKSEISNDLLNLSPIQISDIIRLTKDEKWIHHGKYLLVKNLTESVKFNDTIRTVARD